MSQTKKVIVSVLILLFTGIYISKHQNSTVVNSDDLFSNSVVGIVVYTNKDSFPSSQGTGVAIGTHLILTNYHVVKYPQKIVINNNKMTLGEAKLKAYDFKSDLAILQTDINLKPVPLYRNNVQKGRMVSVAHKNRLEKGQIVDVSQSIPGYLGSILKYLKIADVNSEHGSSGGAVLNSNGELLGILSARSKEHDTAYSYAIPVNDAHVIIESLLKKGKFDHIILGIEAEEFGSTKTKNHGVKVSKIVKGALAQKALRVGDIITSINNMPIDKPHDLAYALFKAKAHGNKLILNIIREEKMETVQL